MRLRPIKNDTTGRLYCGPVAVAAITGRKASKVLDAIRRSQWGKDWKQSQRECYGWRRRPQVRGTYVGNLLEALDEFGYRMWPETFQKPMTIDRWAGIKKGSAMAYLIEVKDHWIAFAGGKVLDTSTNGMPVRVRDFKHRATPVLRIWRVYKRTRR